MSASSATTTTYSIAESRHATAIVTLINAAFASDKTDQAWLTDARVDIVNWDMITGMISGTDTKCLIATSGDDESILACCFVRPSPDDADIARISFLCVQPDRHKQGLGRKMLLHAEEYVRREWGRAKMELNVVSSRLELRAWYESMGYEKTGRETEFPYGDTPKGILREGLSMVDLRKVL